MIVAAEFDGPSFITALDRRTGAEKWRIARPNNTTFSTPALVRVAGRDLLAITGGDQMVAYDPADGQTVWAVTVLPAATCGTIVSEGDVLFASGGYPRAETAAVRATDGKAEVLWKTEQKCYEQSMIVVDGHLYALTDNGVLFCFRGHDGREMWRRRLRGPVERLAGVTPAGGSTGPTNTARRTSSSRTRPNAKCSPKINSGTKRTPVPPSSASGCTCEWLRRSTVDDKSISIASASDRHRSVRSCGVS